MLRETSQEKALRLAAVRPLEECAEIQARIRKAHLRTGHDPDGRPPRLERLVAYIGKHLFEGTLSVEGACKEVGIGDGGVGGELRAYIGFTVDEFIDKLRIDTAFPLVAETGFSFGDIAHLVGFRTYRTFTRTFKIWVGEPPRKTRKRYRGGTGEPPVDLPVDLPFDFRDFRTVRRVGEGAATPNDLERLRRALSELYPDTFGDRGPDLPETVLGPPFDAEVLERFQAERVVWPALADLSFAEQRRYVGQCRSWTSALFDLLHEKSREEGRRDRQRGIELAQLAIDSLGGNDGRLGERIHSLRAQGWAWLGNARRLALDFPSADSALKRAEAMLQVHGCRADPFASGVICWCRGMLDTPQLKYQEAVDLFDRALELFREAGSVHWQVHSLLRRAAVCAYAEQHSEVVPSLKMAAEIVGNDGDEALRFQIAFTAAVAALRAGKPETAKSLAEGLPARPERMWRCQTLWLKGNVHHEFGVLHVAEDKYLSAWRELEPLDELLYKALLLLDLAILYADVGRLSKATELALVIHPIFETVRMSPEAMAGVQVLGGSFARSCIERKALVKVRSVLRRDPLFDLAIEGGVKATALTPDLSRELTGWVDEGNHA